MQAVEEGNVRTRQRIAYFDNIKFILIFLVVLGHIISPFKGDDKVLFTLYNVIFLFHMPAFILISGYFSKGFKKKGYLKSTFKKILLPYFFFQVFYSFFYYWNGTTDKFKLDFLEPHWTMWFLLSLFFWNVLLYIFAPLRWAGLIIAIIIGCLIGYIDSIGSYLSLSRTFVFFPYFLLGFLLKPDIFKVFLRSRIFKTLGLGLMIGTIVLFAMIFPKEATPWLLGRDPFSEMSGLQFSSGFIRLIQYVLTLIVVLSFFSIVPRKSLSLTYIGEWTMYIFLLHGFVVRAMIIPYFKQTEYFYGYYILLIGVSLLTCIILSSSFIRGYTQPFIEPRLSILSKVPYRHKRRMN